MKHIETVIYIAIVVVAIYIDMWVFGVEWAELSSFEKLVIFLLGWNASLALKADNSK